MKPRKEISQKQLGAASKEFRRREAEKEARQPTGGFTRDGLAKAMKGLKRFGHKIPGSLKPR